MLYVNILDRERADSSARSRGSRGLRPHVVATEIPIGAEDQTSGVIDLVDMKPSSGLAARGGFSEIPIPRISGAREEYARSS